jgi:hypothetical protein
MIIFLIVFALLLPLSARAEEISEGARQFLAKQSSAQEKTWNHFGVIVTQQDVSIKEAHDTCAMHPNDPLFWQEPCETVERQYWGSGSKAKFDEVERRDAQSQVDAVRSVIGK